MSADIVIKIREDVISRVYFSNITLLSSLFRLQKRAIRIITSSSYKAHTHDVFVALQMLKLENIYTSSVGIFMSKLKNECYLLLKNSSDVHNYSTRQSQSF